MPNNWEIYAPYLIIFVVFATTYKIFVTPNQLNEGIKEVKKDENNIIHCEACNGTTVNYLLDLD